MMLKSLHKPLALAALALIAACNSSSGSIPSNAPNLGANNGLVQQNFVGIGDSLTFGEESNGNLGALVTSSVSALPGGLVQATQTNGFWALMYAQKNNITLDPAIGHWNLTTVLGSSNSPLPLIKAPGLAAELVVSTQNPGFAATHSSCDSFNQAAFGSNTWETTRVNPSGPIADLAIPGITTHETVSMVAPLTGPSNGPNCGYVPIPGDPTSGGLQSLVATESTHFLPVLGQFQGIVKEPTMLNDAVYLKPQLVTVWLGGNDLLHCVGSGPNLANPAALCNSLVTDTPAQFAADLTQIVTTLEAAGAKVVIGNLPDIWGNPSINEPSVPQYFPQTKLSADMQALGVPAAAAGAIASYISTNYTKGNGGFLTETGFFSVLGQFSATHTVTPQLDPNGPGSGDGQAYIDQTFAAGLRALNAGYNQAAAQVAAGTNSALADIQSLFKQIAATGVPLAPGCTLTTQFGGGLLSYDGIHPSNTGYALIANVFIGAANTKFSSNIPLLNNASQIGPIAQNDSNNPCVIKSQNPAWPYPLP